MDEREAQLARRIGDAVRHHRQLRGLSQEALAERVELSTHFVGLVERGRQLPSLTTLLMLSRTLGIDPDDLLRPSPLQAAPSWQREALAVFGSVPIPFRPAVLAMLKVLARTSAERHRHAAPDGSPHTVAERKRRRRAAR